LDVLRTLRSYDAATKVAIITGGLLDDDKIKEVEQLGIVELLIKPVDFAALERVVMKALNKSYPRAVRVESAGPNKDDPRARLRRITHELANVTSDIRNKCELYVLDTEDGLNRVNPKKRAWQSA